MNRVIRFTVEADPVPQPRARHAVLPGQSFVHIYTPRKADGFKGVVRIEAMRHAIEPHWTGPVRVAIEAYFPRTKELMRAKHAGGRLWYRGRKGDADNIAKSVLDAITPPKAKRGTAHFGLPPAPGIWLDDKQIVDLHVRLFYTERGGAPRAEIEIELLEEGESTP